jgi:hypothetical protein
MDKKLYENAIKDAQAQIQCTPNAEARSSLVRKILIWREKIRKIEGKKYERFN